MDRRGFIKRTSAGSVGLGLAPYTGSDRSDQTIPGRWSVQKARQWYRQQPWIIGCNYIPRTAINPIEMWQQATFDPQTIDQELDWAQNIGFNTVRIFCIIWFGGAASKITTSGLTDFYKLPTTIILKQCLFCGMMHGVIIPI